MDEPADLKGIPHPRAMYTGVVKGQLDFALILSLAERHAEWSFVLVGPRLSIGAKADLVARLERLPNVHFLGGKPIEALPAYVQHADVTMMCYELTAYTNFIYPMKLHEYLASGRPVIGTPIRTLLDFSQVVSLARTPDEWSAALAASLSPAATSAESVAARRAVAAEYDWDAIRARVLAAPGECAARTPWPVSTGKRGGAADERSIPGIAPCSNPSRFVGCPIDVTGEPPCRFNRPTSSRAPSRC